MCQLFPLLLLLLPYPCQRHTFSACILRATPFLMRMLKTIVRTRTKTQLLLLFSSIPSCRCSFFLPWQQGRWSSPPPRSRKISETNGYYRCQVNNTTPYYHTSLLEITSHSSSQLSPSACHSIWPSIPYLKNDVSSISSSSSSLHLFDCGS